MAAIRSSPWKLTPLERTIDHLKRLGHQVSVRSDVQHGWGPVSLITIDEHGKRTAAADPRVDTATAAVN